MPYEPNPIRRQKIRYNSSSAGDTTLVFQLVEDGDKLQASTATITIYAPGNATAVVSAAVMNPTGTLFTYAVDTTTTASYPIDEGYRAEVAVVLGGTTYNRHFIFDVVKYHLRLGITKDQLIALDDSISGMRHDTDDDFSELIEACRDHIQTLLETNVLQGGGLVETMIVDRTRVAVATRLYILSRIHMNKGDLERAELYRTDFDDLFRGIMSTTKFDKDQDGEEDVKIGGLTSIRLVT